MKLYTFNINSLTENEFDKWYNLMTLSRKSKVDRKKLQTSKYCTVAGEMLVKNAISQELNIVPDSIEIYADEKGKPYAKNINLHFSISHSDNMVVCVTDSENIGVDIEKIRPIDLAITKKVCTKNELLHIFNREPLPEDFDYCEDTEMLKKFFEIWTVKEAYFKCIGTGITNLKSIDTLNLKCKKNMQIIDKYIIHIVSL